MAFSLTSRILRAGSAWTDNHGVLRQNFCTEHFYEQPFIPAVQPYSYYYYYPASNAWYLVATPVSAFNNVRRVNPTLDIMNNTPSPGGGSIWVSGNDYTHPLDTPRLANVDTAPNRITFQALLPGSTLIDYAVWLGTHNTFTFAPATCGPVTTIANMAMPTTADTASTSTDNQIADTYYSRQLTFRNPYVSYYSDPMGGPSSTPTPPVIPPVVSNMIPAAGTGIYPTSPLQFDVTDDSGLFTAVIVLASYPDGSYEVVYDSAVFATKYRSSTMSIISGGFRFILTRVGGWPASPSIRVIGIDAAGAENVQ